MPTHVPTRHAAGLAGLVWNGATSLPPHKGPGRYNATKVTLDGITFDSKAEAKRYGELKMLARAGEVSGLKVHPEFRAVVNGVEVTRYRADFLYWWHADPERSMRLVVEDVKSQGTRRARDWPLRKRLVEAACRVTITEVLR